MLALSMTTYWFPINSELIKMQINYLTLFRMDFFGAAQGWICVPSLKLATHVLQ